MTPSVYEAIYRTVQQIPKGSVATYGQIARLSGIGQPRRVGYALSLLSKKTVPWHRVVNAKGQISPRASGFMELQHELLKKEGIVFEEDASISLTRFQWQPKSSVHKKK